MKVESINVRKAAKRITAINNVQRIAILKRLSEGGEQRALEICADLHINQTIAWRHLDLLERTQLVKRRRVSKKSVYYSIKHRNLSRLLKAVNLLSM